MKQQNNVLKSAIYQDAVQYGPKYVNNIVDSVLLLEQIGIKITEKQREELSQ